MGSQGQGPSLPGSVLGPLLAPAGLEDGILPPPGQALGKCSGSVPHPCVLQFWGRGFSPSSISEVPGAPLYKTASPVRSQLQRGCFCGGSRQGLLNVFPSQIQTFSAVPGNRPSFPTLAASWSQGCIGGGGGAGLQGHILPQNPPPGLPAQTPSVPPPQAWHPLPIHTPQLRLRREPWNWRWGVGRGAEKNLIPWMAVMAPAPP